MPIIRAKDGSNLSFSDQGSGSPVLFLHGWMMSEKVWHFQLPLSASLRIITMDLRGHGSSDAPDFSYAACLNDIETLLDYLEIGNVIVAGWSMGSQIAIKAYALLQERISGLILVGGTPRFCSSAEYTCGLAAKEARGMAIRLKRDYRGTSGQFFTSMFSMAEKASRDLRDITAKTVAALPPLQISLAALDELTGTDLRQLLPCTSIPVHLIHGEKDSICPVGAAEFMASHLPRASIRILPLSGHAPFMTAAEKFNAEVSGFVRTVNG